MPPSEQRGRKFEAYDPGSGPLKQMGLLVGITGPSFSGKSYSAGRISEGIRRVFGGEVYWVDTENDRALELHQRYGGPFKFKHVPFPRPGSPAEYVTVVEYCLKQKDCGVIIMDNMTHEHVALLDMMEDYMQRKGAGDDWEKRDRLLFASMVVPKAQRKRLNELIAFGAIRPDGQKVPMVLLYRGRDQTKPGKSKREGGDGKPVHKGWQAETSSDLPFYMTARFLLPPGSDGKPNINPDTEWERLAIKNPQQFRGWFEEPGFQLTEEIGERLARWAMGDAGKGAKEPRSQGGAVSPGVGRHENAPAGQLGGKAVPLLEVVEVLKKHLGSDKTAAGAAVRDAFGCNWKEIEGLPAEQIAVGLGTLKKTLEGVAAMRKEAEKMARRGNELAPPETSLGTPIDWPDRPTGEPSPHSARRQDEQDVAEPGAADEIDF